MSNLYNRSIIDNKSMSDAIKLQDINNSERDTEEIHNKSPQKVIVIEDSFISEQDNIDNEGEFGEIVYENHI